MTDLGKEIEAPVQTLIDQLRALRRNVTDKELRTSIGKVLKRQLPLKRGNRGNPLTVEGFKLFKQRMPMPQILERLLGPRPSDLTKTPYWDLQAEALRRGIYRANGRERKRLRVRQRRERTATTSSFR